MEISDLCLVSGLLLIFGCIIAGVSLQFVSSLPRKSHQGLNTFLIYLSLPAITLRYLPELELNPSLLLPAGMAWIVFLFSWGIFTLIGRWQKWSVSTIVCLTMVAGLGNTSFVGFPLISSFYGEEGLKLAVICDQPGSFLVVTTLGLLLIGYAKTGSWQAKGIIRRLLGFPPFLAFLVTIPMMILGITFPVSVNGALEGIGQTLTPVAMVSIGLQLQNPFQGSTQWKELGLGLLSKLLLAPAIISFLYLLVLDQKGLVAEVSVLEAAMPPMVTPAILVMERKLNPTLASLLIAVGIPIGIGTVFLWKFLLF